MKLIIYSPGIWVIHIWRTIYRRLSQCITNKSLFVKISPDPPSALTDFMHPAMHTSTSSFGLFQNPPCVDPWILSVMILKWRGVGHSPPRIVFVFLFAGIILCTPGVQVMAKAHCQLPCPMQNRLCCSILSLWYESTSLINFPNCPSPMRNSLAHAGWTWCYNRNC